MAPCQLQARAASAFGRPHKMCYKSLFKCAFVHRINRPNFNYRSSLRTDLEESTSPVAFTKETYSQLTTDKNPIR